jgi:RNA polymerase sigma factor (sigma-70 family)
MAEHATIVVDARSLRAVSFSAGRLLDTLARRDDMHTRRHNGTSISHDEQTDLFRRLHALRRELASLADTEQTKDRRQRLTEEITAIRHQLASVNRGLCYAAARRYVRHDQDESLDELAAEGCIGLMRAIDKFSPDKGTQFSTFATVAALHAIWALKERNCRHRMRFKTGCDSVLEQTADYRADDVDSLSLLDRDKIRRLVDALPPRLRMIIRTYYGFDGSPRTIRQLARTLRVSAQRVSQLLIVARDKLRAAYSAS